MQDFGEHEHDKLHDLIEVRHELSKSEQKIYGNTQIFYILVFNRDALKAFVHAVLRGVPVR